LEVRAVDISRVWVEFSYPLKRFISKRIPNNQDADDVLQDVFVKIHSNSGGLKDDTRIQAWVSRITRNAVAEYYGKKGTLGVVELPD